MAELADGDLPDETDGTGVFLVTMRTYPYPFPDRYHSLAMTASAMADCGEVEAWRLRTRSKRQRHSTIGSTRGRTRYRRWWENCGQDVAR